MRLGDLDALFCRFWGKADPFKEQPSVKPSAVWSEAATLAREAPTMHFHCWWKKDDKLFQFYAGTGKIQGVNGPRGIHALIKILEG